MAVENFLGLTQKLDYLQWLGVACLWLLPMYPSPLRDGGYDVADYFGILPEYGTLDEFTTLLEEAHARDIRVITDLVLNHTSDQHLWFQDARSSHVSPKRNWYVWSSDEMKYETARIVFIYTEKSDWAWDDQTYASTGIVTSAISQTSTRQTRSTEGNTRCGHILAQAGSRRVSSRRRADVFERREQAARTCSKRMRF